MITLRPYQENCIQSVLEEWKMYQSTLAVAATGLGKTTIFAEIIRGVFPKRCMVLVHRKELIEQAVDRLRNQCGIICDIEKAHLRAREGYLKPECVVASVQTLISGEKGRERMTKFSPNDYDYIIIDEAHRATAKSYRRILAHFKQNPDLKILGVTATPDRADDESLKQVFESVAFNYEILDGIHDGWLVPVDQQMVYVESINFDKVKIVKGDLKETELAKIMEQEETLQGVAHSAIQIIGSKRSLAFAASVMHAKLLSDIFNRHKYGMADFIHGETPEKERDQKLESFRDGTTQIMVNCGIFTEGADFPFLEAIIQARPTKSRSLYAQIIGRALRPLPGIVDGLNSPQERKISISQSRKPVALIIDYVGNGSRHKLMTSANILGGKISPEALDRAAEKANKKGSIGESVRMDELLDQSEEEIKAEKQKLIAQMEAKRLAEVARKAHLVGNSTFSTSAINPFDKYHIQPKRVNSWDDRNPLTENQVKALIKNGVNINGMSMTHQKQLFYAMKNTLSDKRISVLKRAGYDHTKFSLSENIKIVKLLFDNNFSKPRVEAIRNAKSVQPQKSIVQAEPIAVITPQEEWPF